MAHSGVLRMDSSLRCSGSQFEGGAGYSAAKRVAMNRLGVSVGRLLGHPPQPVRAVGPGSSMSAHNLQVRARMGR